MRGTIPFGFISSRAKYERISTPLKIGFYEGIKHGNWLDGPGSPDRPVDPSRAVEAQRVFQELFV
jgi:hypothetical protein